MKQLRSVGFSDQLLLTFNKMLTFKLACCRCFNGDVFFFFFVFIMLMFVKLSKCHFTAKEWLSGKQLLANKSITLLLCPQQQMQTIDFHSTRERRRLCKELMVTFFKLVPNCVTCTYFSKITSNSTLSLITSVVFIQKWVKLYISEKLMKQGFWKGNCFLNIQGD